MCGNGLNQLSMLLFYFNCMYKSKKFIESLLLVCFGQIAFGQNILLSTFVWPKHPGQDVRGQSFCPLSMLVLISSPDQIMKTVLENVTFSKKSLQ